VNERYESLENLERRRYDDFKAGINIPKNNIKRVPK